MLAASTAFNEAFKSDLREVKMWIKINDVTYTDEDIVSFNFTSGSITGDSFAIGSTFANSVKLTLCKVVEGLKVFDTVLPEMGIVLEDESVEYVKLGTFLITEEVNPDRNENRTSIECTDQMVTLDDPYNSKLKYPAKIRDVALEIANLAGVKVDSVSFGRLMDNTIREPKGYSFREAIGLIAQFEAGYATFDRNGLLAVKTLYDPQYKITPDEYFLKGLVKNELMFRPAGIEVKIGDDETKNLSIGNKKGSVIHLENKVMTERLLRLVYEKIRNINYYPYSLNWRGNPAIEAGDWLYIKDTKGNEYKLPNLNYTMEYKGGLTAISTVETVASNDVKFKYRKILDQAIEYVNNSIKDMDGSMNYYGAEEPSNPKNGDIWFKYVGSDTEIWIYQKVGEPDKFEWVLQISSAIDESIKEKIEVLEKESKENQEKVDTSLLEAEKAREQAELARKEAFDSGVVAKQAEKDALNAIAQGDQNSTQITTLDGQQKLTNTKVEGNTANILSLQSDSEKLSLSIGKVENDIANKVESVTNEYYISNSDENLVGGIWTSTPPKKEKGKFVFTRTKIIKGNKTIEYKPSEKGVLMTGSDGQTVHIHKAWSWSADGTDRFTTKYPNENLVSGDKYNISGNTTRNVNDFGFTTGDWAYLIVPNAKLRAIFEPNKRYYVSYKVELLEKVPNTTSYSQDQHGTMLLHADNVKPSHRLGDWVGKTTTDFDSMKVGDIRVRENYIDIPDYMYDAGVNYRILAYGNRVMNPDNTLNKVAKVRFFDFKIEEISKNSMRKTIYTPSPKEDFDNAWPKYEGSYSSFNPVASQNPKDYVWQWTPHEGSLTTKQEFATFEATVKGFQTSVNSEISGLSSQQTQMDSQISSTVEKVDNLKIGVRNIAKNSDFNVYSKNGDYSFASVSSGDDWVILKPNTMYTLTACGKASQYGETIVYMQNPPEYTFSKMIIFTDKDSNSVKSITFRTNNSTTNKYSLGFYDMQRKGGAYAGWLVLSEGDRPVYDWQPAPEDNASKSEVIQLSDQITQTVNKVETVDGKVTSQQSQITQLSNNISLKVDKDKAVAQINLSPETIRLDAKRIHLAGASLIDDAVIKEAMIADAAITNAKIQNATISDAKIISINANKVNASTLSAITTNTGQLNVTGWLDFTTENRGLRGWFDFYDVPDESYYSRWYDGELRLSHRHMILTSNIYNVNANSTRGSFKYYSETMYGPDYVKLRQYKNDKKLILSRVDIRADAIEIGQDWSFAKSIVLRNNGTATFGGKVYFNGGVDISLGLRVGRIEAPVNYQTLIINEGRNLGTMIFSNDGQRYIRSMDIYDRTYNSQPQVCITDEGTLGRIVSARKYKTEIWTAYDLIDKAKNVLSIQPKSWVDKMKPEGQRHYGFIADEFEENNLREVVLYGSNGDVEGLSYDRITTYHNVILSEHEREIQELKTKIKRLEEGMLNGIIA